MDTLTKCIPRIWSVLAARLVLVDAPPLILLSLPLSGRTPKAPARTRPEAGKERLMEPLTHGILIALFLWATVAVIKKGSWKKPEPSCHVYIRQGDDKPVADC